jgi:hypothetical protein
MKDAEPSKKEYRQATWTVVDASSTNDLKDSHSASLAQLTQKCALVHVRVCVLLCALWFLTVPRLLVQREGHGAHPPIALRPEPVLRCCSSSDR